MDSNTIERLSLPLAIGKSEAIVQTLGRPGCGRNTSGMDSNTIDRLSLPLAIGKSEAIVQTLGRPGCRRNTSWMDSNTIERLSFSLSNAVSIATKALGCNSKSSSGRPGGKTRTTVVIGCGSQGQAGDSHKVLHSVTV